MNILSRPARLHKLPPTPPCQDIPSGKQTLGLPLFISTGFFLLLSLFLFPSSLNSSCSASFSRTPATLICVVILFFHSSSTMSEFRPRTQSASVLVSRGIASGSILPGRNSIRTDEPYLPEQGPVDFTSTRLNNVSPRSV